MSSKENTVDRRIGSAVRRRRQALNLSLRPLAAKSGVSASRISEIERGTKSPTISTLYKLADAMHVPVTTLIEDGQESTSRIRVALWTDAKRTHRASASRVNLTPAIPGSTLE